MPRITPLNPESATGKAHELLDAVNAKVGFVPNMMSTLAVSPATLEAYLQFSGTLNQTLDAKTRELISLAVAELNGCDYCASAHTAIGKMVGLKPEAILDARRGAAEDQKQQAVLDLARAISFSRGKISQDQYDNAVEAGLSDREIVEVVGNVALNFLTNTFNNVVRTTVDFPAIESLEQPVA